MLAEYFHQSFELSEHDVLLDKLARHYHASTEAYDRTVCTGPIVRGEIQPASSREFALINRNASYTIKMILAEEPSITIKELYRAINRLPYRNQ